MPDLGHTAQILLVYSRSSLPLVWDSAHYFRWHTQVPRAKGYTFLPSVLLLLQCHCTLHRIQPPCPPKHLLPMGASLFWASFSSSAFLVCAQFFHTSSPSSGFREFGSRSSGEGCGCDCGSTSATWTVWAYEREIIKTCQQVLWQNCQKNAITLLTKKLLSCLLS